jgi:hypothetical protein
VAALEESLRSGLIRLDSGDVLDSTTQATLAFTGLGMDRRALLQEVASFRAGSAAASADPVVQAVAGLRSGDVEDVRWALRRLPDLPAAVTGHAVPLLARTDLYLEVLAALRLAAPRATGQIVDALLDPSLPPEARRRIPRVLRGCPADRAVAGLVQALEDGDFEVRRQSALALERLVEHDPALRPSREVAFGTAIRELERGPVAWSAEAGEPPSPGDASPGPEAPALSTQERGLAHVFTLLALALDREPTRIAHRALRGGDPALRGTALEYLENVLPEAVRAALWPHLGVGGRRPRSARPAHEVERELLRRKP